MPHIKRFAGASAGAITAALLAAGLNSAQLFTELGNQRAAAAQTRDASGANVRTRERLPAVAAPCGVARSPLSLLPAVAAPRCRCSPLSLLLTSPLLELSHGKLPRISSHWCSTPRAKSPRDHAEGSNPR